jgi:tRNA (cmo5U34)-methyltransferase
MIQQLEERITASDLKIFIKPICSDVVENNIENASFVVLNYTLQFIDWAQRDELIARVYSGLQEDGALLLAEKIIYEDAEEEALMQQLHENFKRDNDYSDLEISQKREALENVLVRDTHEQHIKRLYQAGFSKIFILAKYLNFISYVAVK